MGIQPENQQYKKPQVPPATPEVKDGNFKKPGLDLGKKVSSATPGAQEESDSEPDNAGQDHE